MKDAETLLKRDAEKLIYDAAVALGKAQMRAQAKDVAEKFQEAGLETYGDLRNADAAYFQDDCGMRKFDAIALYKMVAAAVPGEQEQEQDQELSSNSDTVTAPGAVSQA